jgi:hypothetical protein
VKRHKSTIHHRKIFFCPVEGCKCSRPGPKFKGFVREDNLTKHYERIHPFLDRNNLPEQLEFSTIESSTSSTVSENLTTRSAEEANLYEHEEPSENHYHNLDMNVMDENAEITVKVKEYEDMKVKITTLEKEILALRFCMMQLLSTRSL